jgi:hypothetical protein
MRPSLPSSHGLATGARWIAAALSVFFFLALGGCDEDEGELSGSVSEFYPIGYDFVRARLYSSELSVEYVRESGEVPVRVTLRRAEIALEPGSYDLKAVGDISGRSRRHEMPRMASGTVEFTALEPAEGARVRGEFSATVQAGDNLASVKGRFDTTLEIIAD